MWSIYISIVNCSGFGSCLKVALESQNQCCSSSTFGQYVFYSKTLQRCQMLPTGSTGAAPKVLHWQYLWSIRVSFYVIIGCLCTYLVKLPKLPSLKLPCSNEEVSFVHVIINSHSLRPSLVCMAVIGVDQSITNYRSGIGQALPINDQLVF